MPALPPLLPERRRRRVESAARADSWSVVAVAGLSVPLAWWGHEVAIAGFSLAAVAAGLAELHGSRCLARSPAAARPWLVGAQLSLLGLILAYSWYRAHHFDPAALWEQLPGLAQRRLESQMLEAGLDPELDRLTLMRTLNVLVCLVLALVTLVFQGLMTLYYLRQLRLLEEAPLASAAGPA